MFVTLTPCAGTNGRAVCFQNQPSVIQSTQPIVQFSKNNVILLNNKPGAAGSVIQSTPNSSVQSIQVTGSDALRPLSIMAEGLRHRSLGRGASPDSAHM